MEKRRLCTFVCRGGRKQLEREVWKKLCRERLFETVGNVKATVFRQTFKSSHYRKVPSSKVLRSPFRVPES